MTRSVCSQRQTIPMAATRPAYRLIVTIAAVALAIACWIGGDDPVIADARGYFELGIAPTTVGFDGAADLIRPYAYPMFVALPVMVLGAEPGAGACRRVGAAGRGHPRVRMAGGRTIQHGPGLDTHGTALYALTVLNPPLQMLATELLTDLMAALLMFGAVMLTLGYEGQSPRTRLRDVGLSLLLAGLAMATRPASITIVAAVVLLWLVRPSGVATFRDSLGRWGWPRSPRR